MKEIVYKYVDFKGLELILKNNTLKFTNPADFNDPFEFHNSLVDRKLSAKHKLQIVRKYEKNLTAEKLRRYKEIIRKESGETDSDDHIFRLFEQKKQNTKVTCFSEIDNNLLMWAHYADQHKGACIGFNIESLYSDFKHDSYLGQVKYYRKLITKNLSKYLDDAIFHWICSKGNDWKYEKEVRIILSSNNCEYLTFDIHSIKEITFGCRVIDENKRNIEKLIFDTFNYYWIKSNEMKISDKKYGLEKNNRR